VRVFKNTWFDKFAEKEAISDNELEDAVRQLEAGQANANLGGNVYKLRVARSGEGKSGGYRVIVLFRSEDKTFYVYGFEKSDKANISKKEKKYFKETAKEYFSLTDEQINKRVKLGKLIEILGVKL